MPSVRRPIRGSRGFYPKKRARRIYSKIKSYPKSSEAKPLTFSGYKAGMTHVMIMDSNPNARVKGQQIFKPVTIIDCPPLSIFGFAAYEHSLDGLKSITTVYAEKLSENLKRAMKVPKKSDNAKKLDGRQVARIRLLCHTNPGFKKAPEVFEVGLGGDPAKQLEYARLMLGKELKISEVFKPSDYVDVIGVSKGKGFQGPVKRFGVRVLGRKFQQMHRKIGAHGQTEPGKVRSTIPQAGQLGFQTRTELNRRILKISPAKDVTPVNGFLRYGKLSGDALMLEGSVVGPTKRMIRIRASIRPPKTKYAADVRYVSVSSKQGV